MCVSVLCLSEYLCECVGIVNGNGYVAALSFVFLFRLVTFCQGCQIHNN